MKVLVVDDDRLNCMTMVQLLTDAGHHAGSFETAEEALEVASCDHVGAIILDLRMPTLDGLAFLKQIRALKPELAVIMMSAFWTPKTKEDARRLGAQAMLTKPFNMDEILAILARMTAGGQPT